MNELQQNKLPLNLSILMFTFCLQCANAASLHLYTSQSQSRCGAVESSQADYISLSFPKCYDFTRFVCVLFYLYWKWQNLHFCNFQTCSFILRSVATNQVCNMCSVMKLPQSKNSNSDTFSFAFALKLSDFRSHFSINIAIHNFEFN